MATPSAEGPTAKAPTAKARAGRDPFFDNAKFLAILLVVAGHAVEDLRDVPEVRASYTLLYMFHMPVFIMLTGHLSRRFTFSGGKARKLISGLAAPYVVFEILYSVYFWSVSGGKPLEITLLRSSYVMWFLLALFFWRLSTPVWQQIRWPLGVAMGISLLSYMTVLPKELTLHRLLGLLPFYVLGLMLRPEHFEPLRTARARVAGALTLAAALALMATAGREMPNSWIYWVDGNEALGLTNVEGTLMRTGMLVAGAVLAFAFLTLVPARRTWFTPLGATTLYAYLLHGFGIQALRKAGFYDDVESLHSIAGAAAVAVAAAVAATLLCGRPAVRVTRWLVEPRVDWMFTGLRNPVSVPRPRQGRPARDAEPAREDQREAAELKR